LAMSSRNGYLSPEERARAPELYRALQQALHSIQAGQKNFAATEVEAKKSLTQLGWFVDYITIRSAYSLMPATEADVDLVILGAARLGTTRLIDNIEFGRS